MNPPTAHPRRSHRKRVSTIRLSTDTTSTLPEYISVSSKKSVNDSIEDPPSDRPPDYPDSAEEADDDTDDDNNVISYLPAAHTTSSPRRNRRFPANRRRQASSNDPYLDSLLARSVHALEMSNALLQSSISTQTSLSTILASDSQADHTLEVRARGLSSRIKHNRDVHENWADDLDEISRGVEGLFDEGEGRTRRDSISSSLPTSNSTLGRHMNRRRPSLDLRTASQSDSVPQLRLSPQNRNQLVSPPPRALTQYIASTSDPDSIFLPSTLGLRASSSHFPRPPSDTASLSLPLVTDKPMEPSTPAYNMLSSFVTRKSSSGSSTPSSSFTSSLPSFLSRSNSQSRQGSSSSAERGPTSNYPRRSPSRKAKSPDRSRLSDSGSRSSRSRSTTPKPHLSPIPQPHRSLTPPIEEQSASSSSSDGCPAKLTVQSLHKILDSQPPPLQPVPSLAVPRPRFLPRSPPPKAESGTSTATASVSRLFTKSIHTSSTRPPSPPKQSSMKRRHSPSEPNTPTSPSLIFGAVLG